MTPALRKLHCSLPKSEVIYFHYCAVNFQRKILAGFITMLSIYRGKFCPVLSSKQTRMFKLLVQWIIFFWCYNVFIASEDILNKHLESGALARQSFCRRNQIFLAHLHCQQWDLSELQTPAHWTFQYCAQLFIF